MATYLMFGSYSMEAIGKISAERSTKAEALIKDLGGEIKAGYAMLGEKDLLVIVELPGTGAAMKASAGLSQLLGIEFSTAPALTIEEFDKLFE